MFDDVMKWISHMNWAWPFSEINLCIVRDVSGVSML